MILTDEFIYIIGKEINNYKVLFSNIIYTSGVKLIDNKFIKKKVNFFQNLDENYLNYYKEILTNTKETKLIRKIHEEIIDSYSEKITHLNKKTIHTYSNIINKFIFYSTSIDEKDLALLLMKEFEFTNIGGSIKDCLKGTVRKYYYCLQVFPKLSTTKEYLLYFPSIISKSMLKVDN